MFNFNSPVQYVFELLALLIFALAIALLLIRWCKRLKLSTGEFVITPYLQLGADGGETSNMEIRFLTTSTDSNYRAVLTSLEPASCPAESTRRVFDAVSSVLKIHSSPDVALDMPHLFNSHAVSLCDLPPDTPYSYEIWRDDVVVFSDRLRTRKSAGQGFRMVARGDPGTRGEGQRQVAERILAIEPSLLLELGDICYKFGLFSEYLQNYFPFQSKILSRILTALMLGNHDVTRPDFRKGHTLTDYPDSLAWYYLWSMPLNGPGSKLLTNVETLLGEKHLRRTFRRNTQDRYPVMGNYSFDYGMAHFVVLDANVYMNWNDNAFRTWLQDDLKRSQARWKIVAWHQPSFTSHLRHRVEQRMRLVADIIQEAGVKLVLTGHAHHYERSFPINFKIAPGSGIAVNGRVGDVDGEIELDKDYDGVTVTTPKGPIYVVSGGGGAPLSTPGHDVPLSRSEWQSFTNKLVFDRYSFTVIDFAADALTVAQMSADGEVFDSFKITQ